MSKVFVTGGTGFLGTHLVERLRASPHQILALHRPARESARDLPSGVRWVSGDLLQARSYEDALAGADVVLHLAATTGKARPADYFRTNVEGTRTVVEQCRRAGVPRFVFVSTIAATFPDTERYYYAQSKAQAEQVVAASGLDFVILRPTIVVGPGSPVLAGLRRLAALPIVPLFGGGRTRVQPIFVDDLAGFLVAVLEEAKFRGELLEVGGPEISTMRELLADIHLQLRGRPARFVHLPLGLILPALTLLEQVAYPILPLTVGQLASFRFDSTAASNPLYERRRKTLVSISEMVRRSLTA